MRQVDFFAYPVGLTFNGLEQHKSLCGGIVTIVISLLLAVQSSLNLYRLVLNPEYSSFPTTYNYSEDRLKIKADLKTNIVGYSLYSVMLEDNTLNSHLQYVFYDQNEERIPAIYCADLFADEIEAE